MKNILIRKTSLLRKLIPFVKQIRIMLFKLHDRLGKRLVISGGKIQFMDRFLDFPEGVGMTYSTPLFWDGPEAYEPITSRTLDILIGNAELFLDIGSNVGIYSVYAGLKYPKVKTLAFEPIPSICEKNRQFHRANGLLVENVYNLAVSDRNGRQEIILPICEGGIEEEQTATLQKGYWETRMNKVQVIPIECQTLDDITSGYSTFQGMCLAKIDVENFEAAVLKGGLQFIAAHRPWIVCEILPDQGTEATTGIKINDNDEIVSLIDNVKYAIYAISDYGYFKLNSSDFSINRCFKDFLLIPEEHSLSSLSYFSMVELSKFFKSE
jgi:FkbM family methyltransferase